MACPDNMQYGKYDTDGSAARRVAFKSQKSLPEQPCRPKQKKILIRVDFLAVSGIVVAVILLLLMMTGVSTLVETTQEVARMEAWVAELEEEHAVLETAYHAGFDPADIRRRALDMGMISAEQAETVTIHLEEAEPAEAETGVFDRVWSFLTGLFA